MSSVVSSYRAAVHMGSQRFVVDERHASQSRDEVLVKVLSTGICGTDLAITASPAQFESAPGVVLGHEIVGTIMTDGLAAGAKVVVVPGISCGACAMCRRDEPAQCLNAHAVGVDRDGGFAEYVSVPRDKVVAVREDLSPRRAVLAEPLGCVLHGIERISGLVPDGVCVIFGAGPIGALFALVLERAVGQRVIVSEPTSARAALLAPRLGAGTVVTPSDLGDAVKEETRGVGAGVVIDAVGSMLPEAVGVAAPRGIVHAFGMHDHPMRASFQQHLTIKELTVTSAYGPAGQVGAAVALLERGVITEDDLVTDVFPLDEIDEAFNEARRGTGLKVLVEPIRLDGNAG